MEVLNIRRAWEIDGYDVSAFLVEGKSRIRDYDLVCFIHDKKSGHHDYEIVGQDFFYRCLSSLFNSTAYVKKIIGLFHEDPSLGVLMPPLPGYAYFKLYGDAWDRNFGFVEELFKRLELNVPLSHDLPPIGPFGSMFWFRPESIRQILDYEWAYEDFPEEPLAIDGTISHGIERIYPYVAQQNGYYSAYVMSQEYASVDLTNSYYVMDSINQILFDKYLVSDYSLLIKTLKGIRARRLHSYVLFRDQMLEIRKAFKKLLPRPLFVFVMKLKRLIVGPRNLKGYY